MKKHVATLHKNVKKKSAMTRTSDMNGINIITSLAV